MQQLISEIKKNFTLIFRNWTSLLLIIIAPLILILLVGYSFSGEDLHDINLGIVAQNLDFSELQQNVSSFAMITEFSTVSDCISSMQAAVTHLCLEITGFGEPTPEDQIPTGEVVFHYDNTRNKVSLLLLTGIKDYFGLTAQRISLASTQEVINNIQELLGFLTARINDLDEIETKATEIRTDLLDRQAQLIEFRDSFTPRYEAIKSLQAEVHNATDQLNVTNTQFQAALQDVEITATAVQSFIGFLPSSTQTQSADKAITILLDRIDIVQNTTNTTQQSVLNLTSSLDETVAELDLLNTILNDEINRTEEYVATIDQSLVQIQNLSAEARSRIGELDKIDPAFASKLVKPISQEFKTLLDGTTTIQIAFPILLSTVIVFICLLFANIITLLEVHNKAYARNILAPVNDLLYVIGLVITNVIIVSFQVLILLLVAEIQFNLPVFAQLATIVPVVLLLMLIFIAIGMVFAYTAKSIQTSILLSTFVALGFFLFSDVLNALEVMPKLAAMLAQLNPLVIVNAALRKVLFFQFGLSQILGELIVLLLYAILALGLLIFIAKRKNKKRL